MRTKTMLLLLLLVVALSVLVSGCEDPDGQEIEVSVEGAVEDWYVKGADTAIEAEFEKVLSFGDDVVEGARDTLRDVVTFTATTDDDLSDLWGVGSKNID